MQDTWPITRERVQAWQDSADEQGHVNGWELRRILSSSLFLPQIVQMTLERSPLKDQALSPEHHWAFGLDKLPEEVAVPLLLDVLNVDVPQWLDLQAQHDAQALLDETRASVHSEASVSGPVTSVPAGEIMLRHPRVMVMMFASTRERPDSSPSSQD